MATSDDQRGVSRAVLRWANPPKRHRGRAGKRNRLILVLGAALTVALALWLLNLGRPPQLGADAEVFRTVDALFTALTARDEKLLGQCAERLEVYREVGKLPASAADHLDAIIEEARAGNWQSAAETLYGFMRAQRRDRQKGGGRREEG